MKKLLLLTITLALAVMCLIAGRGTAYADVLDGDSNTVLLAPSSVCSDGTYWLSPTTWTAALSCICFPPTD